MTHESVPPWSPRFDQILRRHCSYLAADEHIDPEAPLAQLGVDSMALLAMVLDIEEVFDVQVPPEMLTGERLGTAGAAWSSVHDLAEKAGSQR